MLKVGDIVKFTHMHETDFNTNYEKDMLPYVGKVGIIEDIDENDGHPYSQVKFEYGVTWYIFNDCLEKGHLEWIKDED